MTKLSSLSIVVPVYNEEETIKAIVGQALHFASLYAHRYEVVLVNDGSNDQTISHLDSIRENNVRVVHHANNFGYSHALWSGFQASMSEYIFFTDADLQFDLKELEKLVASIKHNNIAIGYRLKRQDSWPRIIAASIGNAFIRWTCGLKVRDVNCAFKLFRKDLLDDLSPIVWSGGMINTLILMHAQKKGLTIKELPVSHFPRLYGKSSGSNMIIIIKVVKDYFVLVLQQFKLNNVK